jgi:hypothetical protein
MTKQTTELAQANFAELNRNPYPGRGIVAGLDNTGKFLVQIYWIMGRSANSRNRVFRVDRDTGRLYTEAAEKAKMTDPSLVIYNAMRERGPHFIVSNGDQTDTVAESPLPSLYLNAALQERQYEPDAPNFTPRITATSTWDKDQPCVQMSILRKSAFGNACDRMHYAYTPHPGFGHCITTYSGDGSPLPPFRGDPLLMPLTGNIEEVAAAYWDALNEENRVSLVVKFIQNWSNQSVVRIINKYSQVG